MERLLALTLSTGAEELVVGVRGEIDMHSGPMLRGALLSLVAPGVKLAVDLREVAFVDSSGLGALTEAWQASLESGASFTLVGPLRTIVHKIFETTGLTHSIPMVARTDPWP